MSRPVGAERLRRLPPYLFAQIEQKIAAKRAAGVDVISLGIGDPDTPTPGFIAWICRMVSEYNQTPSSSRSSRQTPVTVA